MNATLSKTMRVAPEVRRALEQEAPVVALESAVITHGLPRPDNLSLANDMEATVKSHGALPATVGLIDGVLVVGLSGAELHTLAYHDQPQKIGVRDFGPAIAKRLTGGTTVSGTLVACGLAGVKVFATGGIGGVHRWPPYDISADLPQLRRTPTVVVCAGAKAILDLPATLEVLETLGVPVIGYQTEEFPAFYSAESGLKVPYQAKDAEEVAQIARAHWSMGLQSAVLVVVPPPKPLPRAHVEQAVNQALDEARSQGIRGHAMTPFLLQRVAELTGHTSVDANVELLKNNARVAARIADALSAQKHLRVV